jgi:hypothetical protein
VRFHVPARRKFTPGEPERLAGMSSALRSRKIRVFMGLCAQCGREPIAEHSRSLGEKCGPMLRERMTLYRTLKADVAPQVVQ